VTERQEFLSGSYCTGKVVRFIGEAPILVLKDKLSQKLKQFLQILTADIIKIGKFCTIHLQYVSQWGLSDIFGGSAP